jgi:hypothetical protein
MKKLLILLVSSLAFGLSLEDRVSQLEKEVKLLKEQISKINSSQKELKTFKNNVQKEIQKGVLLTCQNLKLTDFKYRYNDGFYKIYDLFLIV